MKFKAIIFDLDGVICFTDEYHYQAWKALADSIDVPFDRTVNNRLRGVSRMASLEIILENAPQKYTPEEKEAFATKKNDLYRELLKNMSEKNLDDRTKDVLTILRQRGYLLAIGSSSKNTPFILERIGLDHFFDVVVDGNCIQHSKPDPEVFLTAAERLHVAPIDCLVVEDGQYPNRLSCIQNTGRTLQCSFAGKEHHQHAARSERYSIGCHKDLPAGQNSGYLRQVIFTGKTNHRKFIREIFEKEGRT